MSFYENVAVSLGTAIMAVLFVWLLLGWMHSDSIHFHHSGRAVYLEGESCVISMEDEDDDLWTLKERYAFCEGRHGEWLNQIK